MASSSEYAGDFVWSLDLFLDPGTAWGSEPASQQEPATLDAGDALSKAKFLRMSPSDFRTTQAFGLVPSPGFSHNKAGRTFAAQRIERHEGSLPSLGAGGAVTTAKKRELSPTKKRAYRRAKRRAEAKGFTFYRGRLFTLNQLHGIRKQVNVQCDHPASFSERMNVSTWNWGGLSLELFEEVKQWMYTHPDIHALMLQETHWSQGMSQEWSSKGLNFIQSSHPKAKQGGVMVILRDRHFPKQQVRWQEVLPGRVLHVRCYSETPVDLICVYQKTMTFKSAELEENFKQRQAVWKALSKSLTTVPVRNIVCAGGDLNCSLLPDCKHVGQGALTPKLSPKALQDRAEIMDCLYRADLVAINTWSRKSCCWTFAHPCGKTQLDYLLVRRRHADAMARGCTPDRTEPLASWREYGQVRLTGSLPIAWKPWKLDTPKAPNLIPTEPSPSLARSVCDNPPKSFSDLDSRVRNLAGGTPLRTSPRRERYLPETVLAGTEQDAGLHLSCSTVQKLHARGVGHSVL